MDGILVEKFESFNSTPSFRRSLAKPKKPTGSETEDLLGQGALMSPESSKGGGLVGAFLKDGGVKQMKNSVFFQASLLSPG